MNRKGADNPCNDLKVIEYIVKNLSENCTYKCWKILLVNIIYNVAVMWPEVQWIQNNYGKQQTL